MAKTLFLLLCLLAGSPAFALRIVSLLPSNTEIVEALGAGDDLVGVTRYDTFPAGRSRANVGDFLTPQWEILLSLKPDVVLAGYWPSAPTVDRLRALHIPVVEVDHPEAIPALYASIRQISHAIGQPDSRAEFVIQDMAARLAVLQKRFLNHPVRSLYMEIDPPLWTIGSRDCLNEGLAVLRLQNVFSTIPRKAIQVSSESVVEKNPDVILAFDASVTEIRQRPGWSAVRAIARDQIIVNVSADDLVRPSPRLVAGLETLADRLEEMDAR